MTRPRCCPSASTIRRPTRTRGTSHPFLMAHFPYEPASQYREALAGIRSVYTLRRVQ